jgi:Skp family chaperone for outer membrane proteins
MVFNDRVLVYQSKSMDITDKVVEVLNKGYKKQ